MRENETDSTEGEQIAKKHRHLVRRPTEIVKVRYIVIKNLSFNQTIDNNTLHHISSISRVYKGSQARQFKEKCELSCLLQQIGEEILGQGT